MYFSLVIKELRMTKVNLLTFRKDCSYGIYCAESRMDDGMDFQAMV